MTVRNYKVMLKELYAELLKLETEKEAELFAVHRLLNITLIYS